VLFFMLLLNKCGSTRVIVVTCRIILASKSATSIEDCEDMHFGEYPSSLFVNNKEEGRGEIQDFIWLRQTPLILVLMRN
jgi:hypothetical protein